MSSIVPIIRAIVREELEARRSFELGVVTKVYSNEGGSGDHNVEVDVRLRESALELMRVPVLTGRIGLSVAPKVDHLVLLGFIGADLNAPVVVGVLHDEQLAAPDAKPTEIVYQVPDDAESGARRLEIKLPNDNLVTITDEKIEIVYGGTMLSIESDGGITMEAAGDIKLKAGGNVEIEAQANVKVKGVSVESEGSGQAKLKGAAVTVAGQISFSAS